MRDRRGLAAISLLGFGLSCTVSLRPPPDASIECHGSNDCPQGYSCNAELERCVSQDQSLVPPELAQLTLDRRIATRGVPVSIRFEVDTELSQAPSVLVSWGGESPGQREAELESVIDRRYEYVYVVGDTEPEGFVTLEISLLSAESVPNDFALPRAIELDFEPPTLLEGTARVELQPFAGAFRTDVEAATYGTGVEVFFAASELLDPVLEVGSITPEVFALACDPPLGTFHRCQAVLDDPGSGRAPGLYPLRAAVSDLAGNPAVFALGDLEVSVSTPNAPRTDLAGALVLVRTPYGTDAQPTVRLGIEGGLGAVDAFAQLVVWDDDNLATATEIARFDADAQGTVGVHPLPGVDRAVVFVNAVDKAGRGSTVRRVWDARWTATLGGKRRGESINNPHTLTEAPLWLPSRDTALQREPVNPAGVATLAGAGVTTPGGPAFLPTDGSVARPSERGGCRMAYVPNRGESILFGGYWFFFAVGDTIYSSETWRWDGSAWTPIVTLGAPSPRSGHGFAYHEARERLVVFGGCNGGAACTNLLGDTWELSGAPWERWERVCWPGCAFPTECPCAQMPSARKGAAMFWDATRGEVVLFGGRDATGLRDDQWTWSDDGWTPLTATPRPSAREGSSVAIDPAGGQVLLVSGDDGTGSQNDTWSWDGNAWTAHQASSAAVGPAYLLFFDEADRTFKSYFGLINQLTLFDGESWSTQTSPPITDASGAGATLSENNALSCGAYDLERGAYTSFGGCSDPLCRTGVYADDETWLFRDDAWRRALPGQRPPARSEAGAAYLASAQEVVLMGGRDVLIDTHNDTWRWDGTSWFPGPGTLFDGARRDFALAAFGPDRVVLFGGDGSLTDQTHTYHYTSAGWSVWGGDPSYYVDPIEFGDVAGQAHAYDVARDELVFFRGTGDTHTWTLAWTDYHAPWETHGATEGYLWTDVAGSLEANAPTSLRGHRMAACPSTGGVLLFGGHDGVAPSDATYLWDGDGWQQLSPADSPPAREAHAMFCDQGRDAILVVGGRNDTELLDDVWEWDGVTWREHDPVQRPSARAGAAVAYHDGVGRGVLMGGFDGNHQGDVWGWRGGHDARPAHVLSARFAAAEVFDEADLFDVAVRWYAGGTGWQAGVAEPGVRLYLWDRGRWVDTEVTVAASPDAPEVLAWSTAQSAAWPVLLKRNERGRRLRRLFTGDEARLSFAVAPLGQNETSASATLNSDYVETTVTYRVRCAGAVEPCEQDRDCCGGACVAGACE